MPPKNSLFLERCVRKVVALIKFANELAFSRFVTFLTGNNEKFSLQVCFDYYIADYYYEKPAHSGKKGYQLSENVSSYFLQLLLKLLCTQYLHFFSSFKLSLFKKTLQTSKRCSIKQTLVQVILFEIDCAIFYINCFVSSSVEQTG